MTDLIPAQNDEYDKLRSAIKFYFAVSVVPDCRNVTGEECADKLNVLRQAALDIFGIPPRIHANGTLEFVLAPGKSGVVQLDVVVMDDIGSPKTLSLFIKLRDNLLEFLS